MFSVCPVVVGGVALFGTAAPPILGIALTSNT